MPHFFKTRVYYEDTDLAGIVYHANYLKFIERARSEMVLELGVSQTELRETHGVVFAVKSMQIDFHGPALFEDVITVETTAGALKGASFDLSQRVMRGSELLFSADVRIVCMQLGGGAARIPADIRQKLTHIPANHG